MVTRGDAKWFERILSGVSGQVSPEWDPARIRAAILGQPSADQPSADQPS